MKQLIFLCVWIVSNSSMAQWEQRIIEEIILDSVNLPASLPNPLISIDAHPPNLILIPYAGGIYDIKSSNWISPPTKEYATKSFAFDQASDFIICVVTHKGQNFLIASSKQRVDTLASLGGNLFKIYKGEGGRYLLSENLGDSVTQFLYVEKDTIPFIRKEYRLPMALKDLALVRNYVLAIAGSGILAMDLEKDQLFEIELKSTELWGICPFNADHYLLSGEGVLELLPYKKGENPVRIPTDKYGSISKFGEDFLLHSYKDNKIYLLSKKKLTDLLD